MDYQLDFKDGEMGFSPILRIPSCKSIRLMFSLVAQITISLLVFPKMGKEIFEFY